MIVDHYQLPMLDMLVKHQEKEPISFHVPGHKNGLIVNRSLPDTFTDAFSWDVTELSGLDDLHQPEENIKAAEELLADFYQTNNSYFLVNGSTVGNLAMILGTVKAGDKVLVQRNCHKSIMNGLKLANADPVFLAPQLDTNTGIAVGIDEENLLEGIRKHADCRAIILTYPNYYGMGFHIESVVAEAHKYNIPVLVDEAHGAHFIAGTPFPPSALKMGADIVVQSAHKTLPSMTMGSFLHINGTRVNAAKVEEYLRMLQSSSPSYPLMLSLDAARSYIATYTEQDKQYMLEQIELFKVELEKATPLVVINTGDSVYTDPLKWVIAFKGGMTGYTLQTILEQVGIFTEMADDQYVLFVLPLLKKGETFPFKEAIRRIQEINWDEWLIESSPVPDDIPKYEKESTLALSYEEMDVKNTRLVHLRDSRGSVAAETIIPYPPGIPLIVKGEIITDAMIEQCVTLLNNGAKIQGGTLLGQGQIQIFEI